MPITRAKDGITVRIRVQPKASRDSLNGIVELGDGAAIKASVSAPPEDGKANAAVIKLLAKTWSVPKSKVSVLLGQTARNKVVHISGNPETLEARLRAWLEATSN